MGANLNLPFGVRVSSNAPLDAERYIVADQTAMDSLIIVDRAYEGLQVYNEFDKTIYFLEVLGATPALSVWVPLTGSINSGTIIPPNMARVSVFGGDDLTAQIGSYTSPFKTITAAVDACRQAIVLDPSLANKFVVKVDLGEYIDEQNLVFAGTLTLASNVKIIGINGFTTLDVTDTAFSGLQNQKFSLYGAGASLHEVTLDHQDQSQRHTISIKIGYIQWDSAVIASEFILHAGHFEATNDGNIYLVDSIDIAIDTLHVGAAIDVSPFIIYPATVTGTLDNNSSSIYLKDVEVENTGRVYITKYPAEVFERHSISVKMDSGKGDIVMMYNTTDWSSIEGDLILDYRYTLLHDNPVNSDTSSTKFHVSGNTVLNIDANITNFAYLQRGLLIAANGDSIVNANLNYTSYSSLRTLYLDVKLNGQLTIDGIINAASSGSEVGIYIYSPNEAVLDDTDNAGNIYFKNVVLRNMNDFIGGLGLWCWTGAFHNLTILGTFAMVGLWSVEKHGFIKYTYNTILPTSADMTRELTIATAGQSVFPAMYKLVNERLQVVMNGITLGGDDYTLSTNDMTLGLGAVLDDEITLITFDANPIIYEMTKWADPGPPPDPLSEVLTPITFITPPTNPTINAILTGPDVAGDGVGYSSLPAAFDDTAYLGYSITQDLEKTVQLISVRFTARVQDGGDTPATVRVSVSNDNFVSQWDSIDYVFSTISYVTKEWYLQARLFSPDKNSNVGIQVRVQVFTDGANIGQTVLFNNFTLKGYHKLS